MNGADALIATLAENGVRTCFANPGTSELHLVAALDRQPGMRAILGLFEGVVTGAADGYGRMADAPAMTLLHLGPGFANGLANLHNARRARSPIINVIGDHAVDHVALDAPLTSDIDGLAQPMSDWVRRSTSADDLAQAGAEAVAVAQRHPGAIATLIAHADHCWSESAVSPTPMTPQFPETADDDTIAAAAAALRASANPCLFLGGPALRGDALDAAGRIQAATGARLVCETFPARVERGADRVAVERLPYFGDAAMASLSGTDAMVLAGAPAPVSFFAYEGQPSRLLPGNADVVALCEARDDVAGALTRLADALDAPAAATTAREVTAVSPDGPLTPASVAGVLAECLPEGAIVSDEAATTGLPSFLATTGAAPHDWLTLTGGAIGQGLPVAVGAAVACPDRPVIALQADGSGLYTLQALWTMAREQLDVTTVIFNNGSYAILNIELARVGLADVGNTARSLLDLTQPAIDWTTLSTSLGVAATRVTTTAEYRSALTDALAVRGPRLIEVMVAPRA
ncbi:MAG: acetolactate synthase large subunit [Pseudomonadota bacterium]